MHGYHPTLAIVIPIGAQEDVWSHLVGQILRLPKTVIPTSVIVVGNKLPARAVVWQEFLNKAGSGAVKLQWVETREIHRGVLQNLGGEAADAEYLWFLHADSRIDTGILDNLLGKLESRPQTLMFHDLYYGEIGRPMLLHTNIIGANIRSRLLKLPFGDQGFCISKALWQKLGKFSETCLYGEDHLFVWKCHQLHVPVQPLNQKLTTSPRRYVQQGWLKATTTTVALTIKQAAPQFQQLVKGYFSRGKA